MPRELDEFLQTLCLLLKHTVSFDGFQTKYLSKSYNKKSLEKKSLKRIFTSVHKYFLLSPDFYI